RVVSPGAASRVASPGASPRTAIELATRPIKPWLPSASPAPAPDQPDDELGVVPPHRTRRRVLLGCVLVAGAIIGLGTTVRFVDLDGIGLGDAETSSQAALPIEGAPHEPAAGPASNAPAM